MMIIIVGPDGSGKSTLAKQLSQQTGYPIQHRSKPKNQSEKDAMLDMYKTLAVAGENVILDRAWYCEMVYGKIMRDESYITPQQMRTLEEIIACNGGGVIVHCSDDTEKLWDRCKERGEDYVDTWDKLDKISMEYEYLLHYIQHSLPVLRYSIDENMS